jgi:hypothetical protein
MVGPNIYTVEGMFIAAVGFGWYEGFQSLTSVTPPLDEWVFLCIAVASLVNTCLCTLPVDASVVQRHFLSLVLALTAAYLYVTCQVLAPSGQTITNSTYNAYYLDNQPPLTPVLLYARIGVALGILCVQVLVAAAAVSPDWWGSPVTGPAVVIAVVMCSTVQSCAWVQPLIYTLVGAVVLEAATFPRVAQAEQEGLLLITTSIALAAQLFGTGIQVYLSYRVWRVDFKETVPFAAGVICLGIPVLAAIVSLVNTCARLVALSATVSTPPGVTAEASRVLYHPTALLTQDALFPAPPTLQSAFYTTEAMLFRPTRPGSQTKKTY